ncbi:MAG TPA: efflux RND transporter periplasmic adaptor subunit [Candidatus Krumholzibacteria bacterium]|nr:efflux RND transporter periplasmic adaptor subunit [Candidatus Krumholzibacteria bacterium]
MHTRRAALAAAVAAVLAGAIMLAGCGKSQAPQQGQAPTVSFVTVGTDSVTLTTELAGRTVPCRTAEIRPQVNGIILKRLFTEGADVVEGQPLYQIDPERYQADLDNAQAALARAEANRTAMTLRQKRAEELLPSRAVSQQDYDDAVAGLQAAEAEVSALKAQVRGARINLERTTVRAPIGGRIGRSLVTEGAVVIAYQPGMLAVIHQVDPIYVDMPQSAAEMLRLKRRLAEGSLHAHQASGGNVRIVLQDGTAYPRQGTVVSQDLAVDPTTGSVVLRAEVPNPDGDLLPDMFVRGIVIEGVDRAAVMVPQQAVQRNARGEPYAWIVDGDNLAQVRTLTVDRTVGDRWLVTAGLVPGDRLVVEGLQFLRQPGAPVQAQPYVAPAPAEASAAGAANQNPSH